MSKPEFDEIIDLGAKYFSNQMTLKGWLGKTLEDNGFDLTDITEEDINAILVRTILKLNDAYEEEIEFEEDQEYESEEDEDEDSMEEDEDVED
jgi:hypothetical protein